MPAASLTLALVLAATAARADDPTDDSAIRKALTDWTEAFNAGDAEQVCDLFAPDLISSFRGAPERGFAELCGQLRRSLADPDRTYRYSLDLKEILVSGDLAAVRLEWTLEVEDPDRRARANLPGTRPRCFPPPARRQLENRTLPGVRRNQPLSRAGRR